MKKYCFILVIFGVLAFFLICPAEAGQAATDGLLIWYSRVVPVLLPFCILLSWVIKSGLLESLEDARHQRILPWIAAISGLLFGFPTGSRMAAQMYEKNLLTRQQAQIICNCCNQMSPAFVGGYVICSMLQCPQRLFATYLIVYLPSIVWCALALAGTKVTGAVLKSHKKPASGFDINMQIIDAGIMNGCETLMKLCGYIVLFSIAATALAQWKQIPPILHVLLTGYLEVTNGIAKLTVCPMGEEKKYVLAICFLCFGGISGIAQTGSMIKDTDLSMSQYVVAKILLSVISSILAIGYLFVGSF